MVEKFTNRDGFTAIVNGEITEGVVLWAKHELEKLDARNDKRKNTKTKAQVENEGIMTAILETLAGGAMVASEIASAVGISTQKASALCKLLADSGKVVVADVKAKGKGTVKQYSLAETDEVAE